MPLRLFTGMRAAQPSHPLFSTGTLKLSDKVQWLDSKGLVDPHRYLHRHLRGDWGEMDDEGRRANDAAFQSGGLLTSRYAVTRRLSLVVVTNGDRSLTVIQLPEENPLL
ncbi:methyltransferase [Acidovorax sp. SUPP2522]|uniref:methyltransferase n=1 Tax=unclassified Acidovorax TaxID=2684926 RepID=UPI0023495EC1|nr:MULTISPECIES: methyltransferase [unclassified Acidovorax]WCM96095.1 methyltransferase [Acidovorax sp. GBBC 1281]GKS83660.1 methyltransferase [Acidovorax sp. SUPP1855]GKT17374.1 methyltransferase [Acidovorax sp. SUPP2522]